MNLSFAPFVLYLFYAHRYDTEETTGGRYALIQKTKRA